MLMVCGCIVYTSRRLTQVVSMSGPPYSICAWVMSPAFKPCAGAHLFVVVVIGAEVLLKLHCFLVLLVTHLQPEKFAHNVLHTYAYFSTYTCELNL